MMTGSIDSILRTSDTELLQLCKKLSLKTPKIEKGNFLL